MITYTFHCVIVATLNRTMLGSAQNYSGQFTLIAQLQFYDGTWPPGWKTKFHEIVLHLHNISRDICLKRKLAFPTWNTLTNFRCSIVSNLQKIRRPAASKEEFFIQAQKKWAQHLLSKSHMQKWNLAERPNLWTTKLSKQDKISTRNKCLLRNYFPAFGCL